MNSDVKTNPTMVPISGRLPEELYQWLATHSFDGATTLSDKLRVAVSTLKRLHDGDSEYADALALFRDMGRGTRESISHLEQIHGHSEVLAVIAEHALAITASLTSAQIHRLDQAQKLEDQLVKRSLQLAESLIRQAITSEASAFDPLVIRRHSLKVMELVRVLSSTQTKGDFNE